METYHHVWLQQHPDRTENWLAERLGDGFAIHHIDGNHANDEPSNLVLIDAGDHWFIHSGLKPRLRRLPFHKLAKYPRRPRAATLAFGKIAYRCSQDGRTWTSIGTSHDVHFNTARNAACVYAKYNKLPWPPRREASVARGSDKRPRKKKPQKPRRKHVRRNKSHNKHVIPQGSPTSFNSHNSTDGSRLPPNIGK